jgi:hypothetical protein
VIRIPGRHAPRFAELVADKRCRLNDRLQYLAGDETALNAAIVTRQVAQSNAPKFGVNSPNQLQNALFGSFRAPESLVSIDCDPRR